MHGFSGLVKIGVSGLVVFAAANGTEVVDVVEVFGEVTVQAQSMVDDVDVEADSVIGDQVASEALAYSTDDNSVFARRGSGDFEMSVRSGSALDELIQVQDWREFDQLPPKKKITC
jgi:hypothetical protein